MDSLLDIGACNMIGYKSFTNNSATAMQSLVDAASCDVLGHAKFNKVMMNHV